MLEFETCSYSSVPGLNESSRYQNSVLSSISEMKDNKTEKREKQRQKVSGRLCVHIFLFTDYPCKDGSTSVSISS